MLILVRKPNESVTLHTSDGDITVKVLAVANDYEGHYIAARVSLAFDAPACVAIERDDMKSGAR